jgi:DNA-binding transcriptional ArsR family regulator
MVYSCTMTQPNKGRVPQRSARCCSGLQGLLSPRLFKALSDPRRLSLLIRLAEERSPCTVGQLAQGSGVDLSVVSRHLAILREAGIIQCEKQGKEVRCVVKTGAVVKILRDLAGALEACCPEGRRGGATAGASTAKRGAAGPARAR